MSNIWILAETESTGVTSEQMGSEETVTSTGVAADPNAAVAQRKPGLLGQPMIMFGLIAVMMYFLLFRGPRKKQQKHKQMVQSLKKNDRVRTIGGIIGTIVDVKDNEITLKIDEANNTKIKVVPSAIGTNISIDKE